MGFRCWVTGAMVILLGMSACDEKSKEHVENAKQATKEAASKAGEAIKESAKAAGESVKDAAAKTGEAVGNAAVKTGEALKESASKIADPKRDPKDGGASASDAITHAKATMQGYIDSLTKGNSLLESLKSPLDATPKLPELKSTIDSIGSKASELLKLSSEQQAAVKNDYKDKLGPMVTKFKAEAERITKDSGLGKILGDQLKSVKLFE